METFLEVLAKKKPETQKSETVILPVLQKPREESCGGGDSCGCGDGCC